MSKGGIERLITFQPCNKNSILNSYYIDLGTLFTLEGLNEKIKIINGSIYVAYDKLGIRYNPLTEAFYALVMFQRKNYSLFLKLTDNLVQRATILRINNKDVAFWYYQFPFPPYIYKTQWISGMAQGVIASVMCRAYYITHNELYKSLCIKAINGMLTPIEYGGALYKGDSWLWIEEYPSGNPLFHVLNGFLFSLLGLYDAYLITNNIELLRLFQVLLKSLKMRIKLYDLILWSKYDCLNIADIKYHFLNTILLYALYKLTNDELLKYYSLKWLHGFKVLSLFVTFILPLFFMRQYRSKKIMCLQKPELCIEHVKHQE